jgi:hypothetical protein
MSDTRPTPTQALFRVGYLTSWCGDSKREFAELIGVRHDNTYAYLADRESSRRVRASAETIWSWCRTLEKKTGLRFELRMCSDGEASLMVTGKTKDGLPFPETKFELKEPGWEPREPR